MCLQAKVRVKYIFLIEKSVKFLKCFQSQGEMNFFSITSCQGISYQCYFLIYLFYIEVGGGGSIEIRLKSWKVETSNDGHPAFEKDCKRIK